MRLAEMMTGAAARRRTAGNCAVQMANHERKGMEMRRNKDKLVEKLDRLFAEHLNSMSIGGKPPAISVLEKHEEIVSAYRALKMTRSLSDEEAGALLRLADPLETLGGCRTRDLDLKAATVRHWIDAVEMERFSPAPDDGELPLSWRELPDERRESEESVRKRLRGGRELRLEEIVFMHGVARRDNLLDFRMDIAFPVTEIFGAEAGESSDMAVYAKYHLMYGEVCDVLDVRIRGIRGWTPYRSYCLSDRERAMALEKMESYCLEQTGCGLHVHRERYGLEKKGILPPPGTYGRSAAEEELRRQDALAKRLGGVFSPGNDKYWITCIAHPVELGLHRIRALRDIGKDVKRGDLGGYVQCETNLSYADGDDAWIYDDAIVCGGAVVRGDSQIRDNAVVSGCACVSYGSVLCGNAQASDESRILGSFLRENASVGANACVLPSPVTRLSPVLSGSCQVYGFVKGYVIVKGRTHLTEEERMENHQRIPVIVNDRVSAIKLHHITDM